MATRLNFFGRSPRQGAFSHFDFVFAVRVIVRPSDALRAVIRSVYNVGVVGATPDSITA